MPKRSDAEKNLANGASALRFIAAIVAFGTTISTMMLASYGETDSSGPTQQPFVGHGVAIASFGIGLCAILLFVAAWADRWTETQYTQRIQREQQISETR